MLDYSLLALFIPTFLVISATPGMCMSLALTLGMTVGVRKTLYMMWGELIGVALVSILAVIGVASLMLNYPDVFTVFKYLGGSYLLYLGIQKWLVTSHINIKNNESNTLYISRRNLMIQGFITAIANPKGWAFTVSLLPSFINPKLALTPQLLALVFIIVCSEFLFLMLYATGGKSLGDMLGRGQNVLIVNRVSGSLMIVLGLWLAFGL